jgi:hypothetical protein
MIEKEELKGEELCICLLFEEFKESLKEVVDRMIKEK